MIPYLLRLDAPIIGTTYYKNNNNRDDMPNCTKFTHDWAQEAVGDTEFRIFNSDYSTKGFPNADLWWEKTILEKGATPRPGSICCCSSVGGSMHVFPVLDVHEDGTCLICDSRSDPDKSLRNDRFFRVVDNVRLVVGQSPIGIGGCGHIQGFIYVPVNDLRVKKVDFLTYLTKNYVQILKDRVNCRTGAGTDNPIINSGCYVPMGTYEILNYKKIGELTWCKIAPDAWVAANTAADGWANIIWANCKPEPDDPTPNPDVDELYKALNKVINYVEILHKNNEELKNQNSELKKTLEDIGNTIKNVLGG